MLNFESMALASIRRTMDAAAVLLLLLWCGKTAFCLLLLHDSSRPFLPCFFIYLFVFPHQDLDCFAACRRRFPEVK